MHNAPIFLGVEGSIVWYHNLIAQILGSMGLVGVVGYGWLFYDRVRLLWRKRSRTTMAFALSYFAMLLISMTNPGMFCPMPNALLMVAMFVVVERQPDTAAVPVKAGSVCSPGKEICSDETFSASHHCDFSVLHAADRRLHRPRRRGTGHARPGGNADGHDGHPGPVSRPVTARSTRSWPARGRLSARTPTRRRTTAASSQILPDTDTGEKTATEIKESGTIRELMFRVDGTGSYTSADGAAQAFEFALNGDNLTLALDNGTVQMFRCTLENGLMYLTPMSNNGAYQAFTDVFRQTEAN